MEARLGHLDSSLALARRAHRNSLTHIQLTGYLMYMHGHARGHSSRQARLTHRLSPEEDAGAGMYRVCCQFANAASDKINEISILYYTYLLYCC